jgi:serine/threonine-protein kinase
MPMHLKPTIVKISDISQTGYPKFAGQVPFKFREQVALQVLRDIGQVILYLSGTGIVHADITPLNVMENRGSIVNKFYYLTDWGATALIHNYPEQTFGSLHFTAPERLLGNIGIKSDLFSIGVTTFYIITGKIPYSGTNGELYYLSASKNDEISPSVFENRINPSLDKLIKDLIRFKEENRPEPEELCKRVDKIISQIE